MIGMGRKAGKGRAEGPRMISTSCRSLLICQHVGDGRGRKESGGKCDRGMGKAECIPALNTGPLEADDDHPTK